MPGKRSKVLFSLSHAHGAVLGVIVAVRGQNGVASVLAPPAVPEGICNAAHVACLVLASIAGHVPPGFTYCRRFSLLRMASIWRS